MSRAHAGPMRPITCCAVNSRPPETHLEACALPQQLVENEALALASPAADCHHPNWVSGAAQYSDSIAAHSELACLNVIPASRQQRLQLRAAVVNQTDHAAQRTHLTSSSGTPGWALVLPVLAGGGVSPSLAGCFLPLIQFMSTAGLIEIDQRSQIFRNGCIDCTSVSLMLCRLDCASN